MKMHNIKATVRLLELAILNNKILDISLVEHLQMSNNQYNLAVVLVETAKVRDDARMYLSEVIEMINLLIAFDRKEDFKTLAMRLSANTSKSTNTESVDLGFINIVKGTEL